MEDRQFIEFGEDPFNFVKSSALENASREALSVSKLFGRQSSERLNTHVDFHCYTKYDQTWQRESMNSSDDSMQISQLDFNTQDGLLQITNFSNSLGLSPVKPKNSSSQNSKLSFPDCKFSNFSECLFK